MRRTVAAAYLAVYLAIALGVVSLLTPPPVGPIVALVSVGTTATGMLLAIRAMRAPR